MKYDIKNLHNRPRSYTNDQGQRVNFKPYEEKKSIKSLPPENQNLWRIKTVEETVKPEDTELKGGEK